MILTTPAINAGWRCSTAIDIQYGDKLDLLQPAGRRAIDAQIGIDDLCCLVIPVPCVPRKGLTESNMASFPHFKEKALEVHEEHIPMIE